MCHHACLITVFLVETRFLHVGQAGLKLLTSGDLTTLAPQSAGITGVSPHTLPVNVLIFFLSVLALLPQLECSGVIIARCSLELLGPSHPPTSATGMSHQAQLIFIFLYKVSRCCPSWF